MSDKVGHHSGASLLRLDDGLLGKCSTSSCRERADPLCVAQFYSSIVRSHHHFQLAIDSRHNLQQDDYGLPVSGSIERPCTASDQHLTRDRSRLIHLRQKYAFF